MSSLNDALPKAAIERATLDATVGSNALTIAIKAPSGSDPSPTEPLFTSFNVSGSGSSYAGTALTTALSVVVSSGSTLGVLTSAAPFRLWLVLFNDAGTPRLAVVNCSGDLDVISLVESVAASSTAEGGAGAADSAAIFYSTVAVSAKFYRVVGFLDFSSGLATPGTWNVAPDKINLYNSTLPLPGDQVAYFTANDPNVISSSTLIPADNTTPQSSEGVQIYSITNIVTSSPANMMEVELIFNCAHSVAGLVAAAFFIGSATDASKVAWGYVPAANAQVQIVCAFKVRAGSLGPFTYFFRAGGTVAGTFTYNSSALFNSKLMTFVRLRELCA